MNPRERHQTMAKKVPYGTPVMCTAMVHPNQREYVLTSSGANPSLAAPIQQVIALMTEMIFEVLTEGSP